MVSLHCGVDLHGNNGYYGIVDQGGKRVFGKRIANRLEKVLAALEPYRAGLVSVVVESTYNWYWLVDGLSDHGYNTRLAHPAGFGQYNGLKFVDDQSDAFFVAELSRLGIVPEGHIYPREGRQVRDLLRRRVKLMQQRTANVLGFQSFISRERGENLSANAVYEMSLEELDGLFDAPCLRRIGRSHLESISFQNEQLSQIEEDILGEVKDMPQYVKLLSATGIGRILGMTIALETGEITRFARAANYVSYCRCAPAERTSNGKSKGRNNRKNGNPYLSWAYIQAANFMRRFSKEAGRWWDRKYSRTGYKVLATRALAAKIARACYYVMRDGVNFDVTMLFG
jgi:transposase